MYGLRYGVFGGCSLRFGLSVSGFKVCGIQVSMCLCALYSLTANDFIGADFAPWVFRYALEVLRSISKPDGRQRDAQSPFQH